MASRSALLLLQAWLAAAGGVLLACAPARVPAPAVTEHRASSEAADRETIVERPVAEERSSEPIPTFAEPDENGYRRALVNVPIRLQSPARTDPIVGFLRRDVQVQTYPIVDSDLLTATPRFPRTWASGRWVPADPGNDHIGVQVPIRIDEPKPAERDVACDFPYRLPRGYEPTLTGSKAFHSMEKHGELFVRVLEAGQVRCERWKFGKHRNGEKVLTSTDGAESVERTYWLGQGRISLGPPDVTKADSRLSIGALGGYLAVDVTDFTVFVVDVGVTGAMGLPVTGYRVATAEPWFRTLEACESYSGAPPSRPAHSYLRSTY